MSGLHHKPKKNLVCCKDISWYSQDSDSKYTKVEAVFSDHKGKPIYSFIIASAKPYIALHFFSFPTS